jgi:hypothetical protein
MDAEKALSTPTPSSRLAGSVPVERDREGVLRIVGTVEGDGRAVSAERLVGVRRVQSVAERGEVTNATQSEWRPTHPLEVKGRRQGTRSGLRHVIVAVRVDLRRRRSFG